MTCNFQTMKHGGDMLNSVHSALAQTGKSNAAVARALNKSTQTICYWFGGKITIPERMRAPLCAAIGAEIDWPAYEAELAEAQANRPAKPERPPALHRAEDRPAPPPAPKMPAEAQTRPVQPHRRLTATPPTQKPTRAPVAPSSAPSGKGGILGFLFDPSDNGMKFE